MSEDNLKTSNNLLSKEVLDCKLESEKRWAAMEVKVQRLKDETNILSKRLDKQEGITSDIQELSKSVALLAANMKSMLDEQKKQNDRLSVLEEKPNKRADQIIDTIIKIVITAAMGIILLKIGLT